jgi:hypothetical protein
MNSRSEGISANKSNFVRIAHKKWPFLPSSAPSQPCSAASAAPITPPITILPYITITPSAAGDAAAVINLAVNRAKMGLTGHPNAWIYVVANPRTIKRGQMVASCLNRQINLTINYSKKRSSQWGHHSNNK